MDPDTELRTAFRMHVRKPSQDVAFRFASNIVFLFLHWRRVLQERHYLMKPSLGKERARRSECEVFRRNKGEF
jgi:hypothetical protein